MLLEKSVEQRMLQYLEKEHHPGLVILGEKGIGKRLMADHIAMKILGTDNLNTCPDYEVVESKNGSILIDQLDVVKKRAMYYAATAPYKVFVIDDADTMNKFAQNALLKILEDGNATNIFIFVAHKPLMDTIHSRCEVLSVLPPTRVEVNEYYNTIGHNVDETIMRIAENRIGLYQQLMADEAFIKDCKSILNQFLSMQKKRDIMKAFGLVKEKDPHCFYEYSNDKIRLFMAYIKNIFVDVLYELVGIQTGEDYSSIKVQYDSIKCIGIIEVLEQHLQRMEVKGFYTKEDFFDLIRFMVI